MLNSCQQLLLALVYAAGAACTVQLPAPTQTPAKAQPRAEAEGAGAVRIKELWEEKCRGLKPSKNTPGEKVSVLLTILEQSPEEQVRAELERVRALETPYESLSDYDKTLLQALVHLASRRGDGEKLVYILSGKTPRYVGVLPLELSLGIKDQDSVLLLFDSYERATAVDTKRVLLEVIGSAFKSLRQSQADDADFLQKSKQWYLDNKTRVKVNPFYAPHSLSPRRTEFFIPKR